MKFFHLFFLMNMILGLDSFSGWFNNFFCHRLKCSSDYKFNCDCKGDSWLFQTPTCIPSSWLCDGFADCEDESDEVDCICSSGEFQCSGCSQGGACDGNLKQNLYECILQKKFNNYFPDCYNDRDKSSLDSTCFGGHCDGYLDCPNHSPHDEVNCSCPSYLPLKCQCNKVDSTSCQGDGKICYADWEKCDKNPNCVDSSDELNCVCDDDEFTCPCIHNQSHPCYSFEGCIPIEKYRDGVYDCPDAGDETKSYKLVACGLCDVELRRLDDVSRCNSSHFPSCDNSTCYETPSLHCSSNDCNSTDVICTSYCSTDEKKGCGSAVQCSDGELILLSQFCNGEIDCKDGSDEMRNRPGFKCLQTEDTCILPQRNLNDNVAQCADHSDLCLSNNDSCFECLDRRLLISSKQVCDGVIDCYDLSDECLCRINFGTPVCDAMFTSGTELHTSLCAYDTKLKTFDSEVLDKNVDLLYALVPGNVVDPAIFFNETSTNATKTTTYCKTKYGYVFAALCDGRPKCRDFSDECNCENPPRFCSDTCRTFYDSFYPFGDHYCDGIEDEFAWNHIDQSACPRGFDEKLCPKRFYCKSGDKISIDVSEVCNGVVNCDDESDENKQNCPVDFDSNLFSSDTEMIENGYFRIAFWIIGSIVILGNFYVIVSNVNLLRSAKLSSSYYYQNLIILNVSCADFLMGIYLLTIAIFSQIFSGIYGTVDVAWRTSVSCSIIGSLAVVSSEASCFFMVILTAYRLHSVCKPFTSPTSPKWPWKLSLCVAWMISLTLGILPILQYIVPYFVHSIYFPLEFDKTQIWSKDELLKLSCRYAALTNKNVISNGNEWRSTQNFLEKNFPKSLPLREFGYYSETSICMPRIYVEKGENAWEYTLAIITLNFSCFLSIAFSYLCMIKETNISSETSSTFHKRIARIIATDFCCWIPICVLAYLRISGVQFSNIVYQISAVFLLSINSAVNPFLYSSLLDVLMEKINCFKTQETTCDDISLGTLSPNSETNPDYEIVELITSDPDVITGDFS